MKPKSKSKKNKTLILFRYGLISFAFMALSVAILVQLFRTTVINAKQWNAKAEIELNKTSIIDPRRGNILSDNGSIMACNITVYDVYIDMRHPKLAKVQIGQSSIDSLADSLDRYYPRHGYAMAESEAKRNELSWRKLLTEQNAKPFNERRRCIYLAKDVQLDDVDKIRNMPFLKTFVKFKGAQSPINSTAHDKRIYPFGRVANLSIGRVNIDSATNKTHGYYGLERDLDTLLYGKPGKSRKVPTTSGMTNQVLTPAEQGKTLLTTINIDMQEMLEEELIKVCREHKAEWGTAILMEVQTGEIKAISSIENIDGEYGESCNRAILPFEPGSVMKPISMLIALEDGLISNVNNTVDCSPFMRTTDPHAPSVKTAKQVIEMSSNTGMARIIFRGYQDHPEKFYDRLESIGFFEPMHTGIAGEYTPKIRRLSEYDDKGNRYTMTARHLDLARQAFGYVSEISPMSTLSVYNAIANGGKYVRPHLVRGYRNENGVDSIFPISYIRDRICSEEHAAMLRDCLHEVVWGKHGTARFIQDDRVEVAGKTGTAFPVEAHGYNTSKRRFAFCGFFPYDNPRYSCIALILAPGGTSAARTSGTVLLNMALKMYAHGMLSSPPSMGQTKGRGPVAVASQKADAGKVAASLGVENLHTFATPKTYDNGKMPDVVGYDLATAVKLLEQRGLAIAIKGQGYVSSQSIAAGTAIKKGQKVTLNLRS